MPDMYEVSIVGGSGYAGGELLRILLQHPAVSVKQVTSSRYAGLPVTLLHPNLRGLTELKFSRIKDVQPRDCLFLALPNGESMQSMPHWMELADKIIDLGADFRLQDNAQWQYWYGKEHQCPHLLGKFQYGVPEIYRNRIKSARLVAGPGCEAIVSTLCLYPFIKQELILGDRIIIDAKMGSSQVGNKPSSATHHPERAGVVRSYKPSGHRHGAEIEQVLQEFSADICVHISATAVEMVRGILVTIHCIPKGRNLMEKDIWKALRIQYQDMPFVRIVKQKQGLFRYPEPKILQGSNFCEIGFELDNRGNRLVILGAIDNLVKGTAGNAVQCMNLMLGFPETLGLEFPGLHPV